MCKGSGGQALLLPASAAQPQLHFAEEGECRWQWHRQPASGGAFEPLPGATGRRYWPLPEDAGCRLRVECTPARHDAAAASGGKELVLGVPMAAECGPVEVPPVPAAAEARHALTAERTASPQLRVVTYNILADQYAGTDTARDVIFAHCPPE